VDIARAFTYVFDDEDWISKVLMVLVWSVVGIIPLIGLVGWAALAGYTVELLRNMRRGDTNPLPRWDNVSGKIADGANVLVAAFVYNIGNFLVICGMVLIAPAMGAVSNGDAQLASTASLAVTCCLTLIMLVYNLIVWPFLGVGVIFYSQNKQIGVLFQVGRIWAAINRNMGLVIQWILFSILASIVLGLVNAVPCIGWLAGLALTVPIQGHLLGQFGLQVGSDSKSKEKPKRVQVRPR
jgi:hypothetical protein